MNSIIVRALELPHIRRPGTETSPRQWCSGSSCQVRRSMRRRKGKDRGRRNELVSTLLGDVLAWSRLERRTGMVGRERGELRVGGRTAGDARHESGQTLDLRLQASNRPGGGEKGASHLRHAHLILAPAPLYGHRRRRVATATVLDVNRRHRERVGSRRGWPRLTWTMTRECWSVLTGADFLLLKVRVGVAAVRLSGHDEEGVVGRQDIGGGECFLHWQSGPCNVHHCNDSSCRCSVLYSQHARMSSAFPPNQQRE